MPSRDTMEIQGVEVAYYEGEVRGDYISLHNEECKLLEFEEFTSGARSTPSLRPFING